MRKKFISSFKCFFNIIGLTLEGESTLLQIIAGAMDEDDGGIIRNNELRIAYLPQDLSSYNGEMTVLEQVLYDAGQDVEEYLVKTYLTRLDMNDLHKPMRELSGEQRKRVALAAVLCSESNLLILDEPTNHMDNKSSSGWRSDFRNIKG